MSAVPLPRVARAPAPVDPPWVDPLDPAWEDPDLDPMELLLLTQLRRWAHIHPGWWPNLDRLGRIIHRSRQSAARYLAGLVRHGYARWLPDGGYELTGPAPARWRPPAPAECQGSFLRPSAAVFGPPMDAGRPPVDVAAHPSPPQTPPVLNGSSKETTDVSASSCLDRSRIDDLSRRAYRLFPRLKPHQLAEAIGVNGPHGPDDLAEVLGTAERHNRKAGNLPVESWGYVMRGMEKIRLRREASSAIEVPGPEAIPPEPARAAAPAPPPPGPSPEELAERERARRVRAAWEALADADREAIRAAVLADNPMMRRWPNIVESLCLAELGRREKKPAAGSHTAMFPPPPAAGISGAPSLAESYSPVNGSSIRTGEHQTPHPPARCATPRGGPESPPDHATPAKTKATLTCTAMTRGVHRAPHDDGRRPDPPAQTGGPPAVGRGAGVRPATSGRASGESAPAAGPRPPARADPAGRPAAASWRRGRGT